jgi:antibiotic biosynthesis monooxygenase (ABM) superfamily enzyme
MIQVLARGLANGNLRCRSRLEVTKMPTEAIVLSIGVCVVFLLFAFAVAWADHSVSQWLRDKASAEQAVKPHHHEPV